MAVTQTQDKPREADRRNRELRIFVTEGVVDALERSAAHAGCPRNTLGAHFIAYSVGRPDDVPLRRPAHEARRAIRRLATRGGEFTRAQAAEATGLSVPAAAYHLGNAVSEGELLMRVEPGARGGRKLYRAAPEPQK